MADTKPYISVLQITDPHIMPKPDATLLGVNTAYYFQAVLNQALQSKHFDLCLLTGDLAQEPNHTSYEFLLRVLAPHHIRCLCLPGNHDDFALMQAVLNTETINCDKVKRYDHWQIIGLNSQMPGSEGGLIPPDELNFLERQLQANTNLNTLIAIHHHCLPTGSSWMDTMMIANANELFEIVHRYPKVRAIINGHTHQMMEIKVGTVTILSTPSTCFQFKPKSEKFSLDDTSPGYRWLELYDDGELRSGVERITERLVGLQQKNQGY